MPTYPPTSEPITSAASPVTSSLLDPIPVPTYGSKGLFSVIAKCQVPASPLEVLNLIRDTSTWPDWNTFCPSCEITSKSSPAPESTDPNLPNGKEKWFDVGTLASINVFMNGDGLVPGTKRSRTQTICVTHVERINEDRRAGYRICWKATGWSAMLHSERVIELVECEVDGGSVTEFAVWETFGGMLGVMVKSVVGNQLIDRFGDYARDVRRYFLKKGREMISGAS